MNSLWKDLLFLHGHITHASLIWSDIDTATEDDSVPTKTMAPTTPEHCAADCCVTG